MATLSLNRTGAGKPDGQEPEKKGSVTVVVRGRGRQTLARQERPEGSPRKTPVARVSRPEPPVIPAKPVRAASKPPVTEKPVKVPPPPIPPAIDRTQEYARETLQRLWPALFGEDGSIRMLKCSIGAELQRDVAARGYPVSTREVKKIIKIHCRSAAYYVAMREGAPRYDIDGTISGYVTASEEEYAGKRLKGIISPAVPGERARIRALKKLLPPEAKKKRVYRHYRAFSEATQRNKE